jgi:hypothetical protein
LVWYGHELWAKAKTTFDNIIIYVHAPTGQSLYGDKVYTGTKFIRGQSLYGTKFIQ